MPCRPRLHLGRTFEILPRVLPFLAIIIGVLYALYGGVATPSETAAVGALLCIVVAMLIYRMWQPQALWAVLRDSTRESVMILFIIGAAGVFSFMLSSLFVTQSVAEWIGDTGREPLGPDGHHQRLPAGGRVLPAAGGGHPDVGADSAADHHRGRFDPYWFAVIVTINMEIGLITPPVGLNLYVINGIAPEIRCEDPRRLAAVRACMVLAIVSCASSRPRDLAARHVMGPAV